MIIKEKFCDAVSRQIKGLMYFCFLSGVPPQSHLFFSDSHHVLLASSLPVLKPVILTVILWVTLHQLRYALHQLHNALHQL